MYSYGSGLAASAFVLKINENLDLSTLINNHVPAIFNCRKEFSIDYYDNLKTKRS